MYAQGIWQEREETFQRKSRSEPFKYQEQSSIIESVSKGNNNFRPSEPIRRGPKRGRKGRRSWK